MRFLLLIADGALLPVGVRDLFTFWGPVTLDGISILLFGTLFPQPFTFDGLIEIISGLVVFVHPFPAGVSSLLKPASGLDVLPTVISGFTVTVGVLLLVSDLAGVLLFISDLAGVVAPSVVVVGVSAGRLAELVSGLAVFTVVATVFAQVVRCFIDLLVPFTLAAGIFVAPASDFVIFVDLLTPVFSGTDFTNPFVVGVVVIVVSPLDDLVDPVDGTISEFFNAHFFMPLFLLWGVGRPVLPCVVVFS